MKKTLRKLAIVFAAALMVMMMAVPSFATTYPLQATVTFKSNSGSVLPYGESTPVTIPAWNVTAQVTYQSNFTTNYTTPFPAPSGYTVPNVGEPTVMDAIYDVYYYINNYSNSGIHIGWDTDNTPIGAYIDQIHNLSEITEDFGYTQNGHTFWTGYSWQIYRNGTKIPLYANNILLQNGDTILVKYEETTETW